MSEDRDLDLPPTEPIVEWNERDVGAYAPIAALSRPSSQAV